MNFRRIGAKRCRTGRLVLDGPFRVGNSRSANSLKRTVQSGGVVLPEFWRGSERGVGLTESET